MHNFIQKNEAAMLQTLKELCAIPAPSHHEEKRAAYCKRWLEAIGAEGVYIDEATNVVFPIHCQGSNEITVFVAHTDTVFPDLEPMPFIDDGDKLYSPGVGDDTASLTVLLYVAKYFVENNLCAPKGVLFVCNSCEEGLGNLKGTRQIFRDYEGRIAQFVSFDSVFSKIANVSVGSHRYEVEVRTEGGHSYGNFGNQNAIAQLAKIINDLYAIEVPELQNSKTTYNVGTIIGGTSVNTIAQSAKMLCEYRSDNEACLSQMELLFESVFEKARQEGVALYVNRVGCRPCMSPEIDFSRVERLTEICRPIIEEVTKVSVKVKSGSTDCNIPLSLGIPAICLGVFNGGGCHTREEWIEKDSLRLGLEIGIRVVIEILKEL